MGPISWSIHSRGESKGQWECSSFVMVKIYRWGRVTKRLLCFMKPMKTIKDALVKKPTEEVSVVPMDDHLLGERLRRGLTLREHMTNSWTCHHHLSLSGTGTSKGSEQPYIVPGIGEVCWFIYHG